MLRIYGFRIVTGLNLLAIRAYNDCSGSIDFAQVLLIREHIAEAFMRERYGA